MAKVNMENERALDWDHLFEILDYDTYTGTFKWKVTSGKAVLGNIAGTRDSKGYIVIGIGRKRYLAHRLAWFYEYYKWPTEYIDHIDGNKSNNAIENLREATDSQNKQNQKKAQHNNSSGSLIPGVSFSTYRSKYIVHLTINGKVKYFGSFKIREEAEQECLKQRRIHYIGNTL